MTVSTTTASSFYIATSHRPDDRTTIYGIGTNEAAAIEDAWSGVNVGSNRPEVSESDDGSFVVHSPFGDDKEFEDRADAESACEAMGFAAQRCTERLYRHVEAAGGADLRWTENTAGLQDLYDDEA